MSIENEIIKLTQSTESLLTTINTQKTVLDSAASNATAQVTDAQSKVALTEVEKTLAETARNEAETHKNLAYTYSQSAASAVAYQDLTTIAESKAETAVDVFVYDTRKDSDGGAWRERTQGTSWYNETLNTATRGSRREFPAVAVIVAETNKVTIYDGDDSSMPMWMVFIWGNRNFIGSFLGSTGVTSLSIKNGLLCIGQNGDGVSSIDFLKETAFKVGSLYVVDWNRTIDRRNENSPTNTNVYDKAIASRYVRDVAMTVLPDAPIDPATGLPIPTIACLVGETEVTMADGSLQRLDQVEVGSMVKTLEGEHKVLNWWDQGVKDVIELEFDGGKKLVCTTDHKIRTTDGWVEAGSLTDKHEVVGL